MGDIRFEHMSDLELVVMRADLKKAAFPEDVEFLKDLDAEIKVRATKPALAPDSAPEGGT